MCLQTMYAAVQWQSKTFYLSQKLLNACNFAKLLGMRKQACSYVVIHSVTKIAEREVCIAARNFENAIIKLSVSDCRQNSEIQNVKA